MVMFKHRSNAVAAALLLAHHRHGNMPPLAAGFVAPTPIAAQPQRRPPPWCEPVSFPPAWDSSRPVPASSKPSASNCNYRSCAARGVRPTRATTSHAGASPSGSSTPKTDADGSGAGSATSSSPSAVVTQAVEGNKHPADGFANGALIPLAAEGGNSSGAEGATAVRVGKWGEAAEGNSAGEFEWEGGAEAAWTEFEDWLLQDTYSRYAIGSGKHVLWRRMVREVPELMERTPQEARERWLRLTGRLRAGGGEEGNGREGGGAMTGPPALDNFYVQPPVLEQWEEIVEGEGMGSFRGNVYGQRGLADGTAMTTAPIDISGRKIQDQYVATQCGVVYELGERRETDLVSQASSKMLRIAPATVLAVAGAFYALTALSHHIQVEVFVI
ncbi:unnamed protein product [Ectocarpus sp. 12 AP-2014]